MRKDELIEYLKENKPKGANEIVKDLKWSKKEKDKTRNFLEELEEEGEIFKIKGNRYTVPEKYGYVKGILEVIKNRFAFIDTANESIFIPRSRFNGALSGDTVLAKITESGGESRKSEGEVVRILKREKKRVIGIFERSDNFGFVCPTESLGKDLFISKNNFNGAKNDELVLAEIIDWGSKDKKPEGKVIEILGDPYDTKVMIEALIKKFGYSETFPPEVRKELVDINDVDPINIAERRDLRNLNIITIDGDDAKDLDDAVYVSKLANGNYSLIVSIADVSHYIKPGTALDEEAKKRGNSVYLVDRVIPMFPREISNGICSLNAGVPRYAFTVSIEIDESGKIVSEDVYKSIIEVKHRMTYKNVNKIMDGDIELREKYSDILDMVDLMHELALKLRDKRFKRGGIDFELPEIKVILNDEGKVDYLKNRERGEAEKIIEDFMIAANEAVAEKIFWLEFPSIYRTHDKPEKDKIKYLNEVISSFGYRIHNIEEIHPGKFQKIIEDSKDKEYRTLVHKMILMAMKQAKYTLENTGHFGLASSYYTHFTSPIRRYSDLIVHRVLEWSIGKFPSGKQLKKMNSFIAETAPHISKTERTAMEAEDESVRIKVVEYMMDRVGEVYDAMITGMNKNGLFFETSNHIECFYNMIRSESDFEFDEKKYKILEKSKKREYNVGDILKIMVVRVSLKELAIDVVPYEGELDDLR